MKQRPEKLLFATSSVVSSGPASGRKTWRPRSRKAHTPPLPNAPNKGSPLFEPESSYPEADIEAGLPFHGGDSQHQTATSGGHSMFDIHSDPSMNISDNMPMGRRFTRSHPGYTTHQNSAIRKHADSNSRNPSKRAAPSVNAELIDLSTDIFASLAFQPAIPDSDTTDKDPVSIPERYTYRDIKGVLREIWQPGDSDGLRNGEFPDAAPVSCIQRFRFLQHDIGPISDRNPAPKYVILDDRFAYEIWKSDVYTAKERARYWFHDFSAQGNIRYGRMNRGRAALVTISDGGEQIDRKDTCGAREVGWAWIGEKKKGRKYHFTGERNGYHGVQFVRPVISAMPESAIEPNPVLMPEQPQEEQQIPLLKEDGQRTDQRGNTEAVEETRLLDDFSSSHGGPKAHELMSTGTDTYRVPSLLWLDHTSHNHQMAHVADGSIFENANAFPDTLNVDFTMVHKDDFDISEDRYISNKKRSAEQAFPHDSRSLSDNGIDLGRERKHVVTGAKTTNAGVSQGSPNISSSRTTFGIDAAHSARTWLPITYSGNEYLCADTEVGHGSTHLPEKGDTAPIWHKLEWMEAELKNRDVEIGELRREIERLKGAYFSSPVQIKEPGAGMVELMTENGHEARPELERSKEAINLRTEEQQRSLIEAATDETVENMEQRLLIQGAGGGIIEDEEEADAEGETDDEMWGQIEINHGQPCEQIRDDNLNAELNRTTDKELKHGLSMNRDATAFHSHAEHKDEFLANTSANQGDICSERSSEAEGNKSVNIGNGISAALGQSAAEDSNHRLAGKVKSFLGMFQ